MTRLLYILLSVSLLSCASGNLRGKISDSKDNKTYLIVADDNGGQCGGIFVDGKKWNYKIGEKGELEPGTHTIKCGTQIEFEIKAGQTFKFDYWGP